MGWIATIRNGLTGTAGGTASLVTHPAGAGALTALTLAIFVVVPYLELLDANRTTTQRRADLLAEQAGLRLQTYFDATINAIVTLSAREPAATFGSEPRYRAFAADIHGSFPGIVAVNWVSPAYTIIWVHPQRENQQAQGVDLSGHPQAGPAIRAADRVGAPRMTPGLNLLQGGSGFAVYVPHGEDNGRDGFVNLAFRDEALLTRIFPAWDDPDSALIISNGSRDVFAVGYVPRASGEIESRYDVPILNQTWQARVLVAMQHRTLDSLLVTGLVLALGIGLALAEVLRRRRRTMETERRLAMVGENAPAAIYQRVLWPDGRVTFPYVSPGLERLFGPGANAERLKRDPKYISDRIVPEDLERISASIRRSAETMTPWDDEFRVVRDDGRTIWLNGVSRPHRDQRGNIVWDGILIDVTGRKTAEQALARSEEQLQQLQRLESLGQLTGGIAHDFNNMLMIILGNLDIAVDRVKDDPKARDAILAALGASERGAELTRQLLAFARKQPLAPKSFNANELVRRVERMLRRILGKDVEIDMDLAEAPWDAYCDPSQLESAIVNLAVNARDAMAGSGKLTISTSNRTFDQAAASAHSDLAPGAYVAISVADTGSGMSPETAARMFEPFFTTKGVGKGTGLGLAMVYGFVKQSGGHVEVDSAAGRGTTVTLYLPRGRATPDSRTAA